MEGLERSRSWCASRSAVRLLGAGNLDRHASRVASDGPTPVSSEPCRVVGAVVTVEFGSVSSRMPANRSRGGVIKVAASPSCLRRLNSLNASLCMKFLGESASSLNCLLIRRLCSATLLLSLSDSVSSLGERTQSHSLTSLKISAQLSCPLALSLFGLRFE